MEMDRCDPHPSTPAAAAHCSSLLFLPPVTPSESVLQPLRVGVTPPLPPSSLAAVDSEAADDARALRLETELQRRLLLGWNQ
eukprot:5678167-Prymnesium_polylepis.1